MKSNHSTQAAKEAGKEPIDIAGLDEIPRSGLPRTCTTLAGGIIMTQHLIALKSLVRKIADTLSQMQTVARALDLVGSAT